MKIDYIQRILPWTTKKDAERLEQAYYAAKHAVKKHGVDLVLDGSHGVIMFYPILFDDPADCICTDLLNGNPDPVVNPDCPLHGPLQRSEE